MSLQRLLPTTALALLSVSSVGAAQGAQPADLKRPERSNILLITVESLRADRLGCYTTGRNSTPAIDALADRGFRFTRAYAASPSTLPSTGTILTGLYPIRHGLRDDLGGRLAEGIVTLAEILGKAGYRSGAVVGSMRLDPTSGLNRGFGAYDHEFKATTAKVYLEIVKERLAEEVVARGLKFLESGNDEKPFFLWLDFFDAHYQYALPRPEAKGVEADPYPEKVKYLDGQIATLIAGLHARKLDRNTHIVLVGSHGEGLGDHGETGHGVYLYESTIKVPLIIVPSGSGPANESKPHVVNRPVSLVDLTPTMMELAGLDPPSALDGMSLVPLFKAASRNERTGTETSGRRLFVEAVQPWAAYGWSALFAVIEGDRKVVRGQRTEAFDLRTDPREQRPIAPIPKWTQSLVEFGRSLLGPMGPAEDNRQKLAPALASLDLPWRGEIFCLEKGNWPDPRDRVDLNDKLFRARSAFEMGLVGRASIISNEILEVDRANFTALDLVTFLAVRNGWGSVLMDNMSILQCNYPFRGTPYHYWGHFLERSKDPSRAEKALLMFSQVEPRNNEAFYDLAVFYASQGKKDLALENLRRAIGLGADDLEKIRQDKRLSPLSDDPRFSDLVGRVPHPPARVDNPAHG
jgi:arylsulfatase A-like enzyme